MKQFPLFLLVGFLLAISANNAQAQSTYTNTATLITLSLSTPDCNGTSPATGTYTLSTNYVDANFNTIPFGPVSASVNQSSVAGVLTVTISAPTANWPDLTTTTGGLTLTQGNNSFLYQLQYGQLTCTALPIILEYFHGAISSSYAYLTWRTDQEQNTSYINVQKSINGSSFTNVGIEPAAGNSSIPINYSFYTPLVVGANYFRLQFVDLDGRLTYSPVVLLNAPSGSYPTSICSFTTLTGPGTLCPGSSGVYKLHNSAPGITWSRSPANDALTPSNGGTEATVTNGASYTGATTLTAATTGCSKSLTINGTPSNTLTISGPATICTGSGSYTLSNLTGIASVTWTVSPTYYATLSTANGTSTTLSRTGASNGYVTLTASYTTSSCSTPVPVNATVGIGVPAGNISAYTSCPMVSATASNTPGATSYQWHVVDMTTYTETITNTSSPNFSASIGNGHSWNIGYAYTNSCGTSDPAVSYGFVCPSGGGGGGHVIKLSPNPSRGIVTLGIQPLPSSATEFAKGVVTPAYAGYGPAGSEAGATAPASAAMRELRAVAPTSLSVPQEKPLIYQIKVIDKSGKVRKIFSYPQGVENISVYLGELPADIYSLQVYDNKLWTTHQVILAK